jgi:steroid delta-isomerase-like uncharacterized protein
VEGTVSAEENKRLARDAIQIWITGDFDAADEIYTPDYVNHQHHDPDDPRDLRSVEAMKAFATEFREAFPDFHDSIDIQIAEGEMVATCFTARGTHKGTFMGVEPTNKELSWTGITIERIAEGRIAESWANWDLMGMMQQLGVIPEPGHSEEPLLADRDKHQASCYGLVHPTAWKGHSPKFVRSGAKRLPHR